MNHTEHTPGSIFARLEGGEERVTRFGTPDQNLEIEERVRDIMINLSPHFGVGEIGQFPFPSIMLGPKGSYYPSYNLIFLPFGPINLEPVIAHEASHWFHEHLGYRTMARIGRRDIPSEFTAIWGEMISITGQTSYDRVQVTQETTLRDFSRMPRGEISRLFPNLSENYKRLVSLNKEKVF